MEKFSNCSTKMKTVDFNKLTPEEKHQRKMKQRVDASRRYVEKHKEEYLAYLKTYRDKKRREKQIKEFLEKYQQITNENPSEELIQMCETKF